MQIGFFGLLMFGALAWGFARVLDAPRWVERAIPFVLLSIMAAAMLLLPPQAPFRQSVTGAMQAFAVLMVAALPFLGYRWVLRRLRARAPGATPAAAPAAKPQGFVLIEQDEALIADLRAAAGLPDDPAPQPFSIAYRAEDGSVTAAARLSVAHGLGTLHGLYLPPAGGEELAQDLLTQVEAEGRRRGATRLAADVFDAPTAALYRDQGYQEVGRLAAPDGPTRITLAKELA